VVTYWPRPRPWGRARGAGSPSTAAYGHPANTTSHPPPVSLYQKPHRMAMHAYQQCLLAGPAKDEDPLRQLSHSTPSPQLSRRQPSAHSVCGGFKVYHHSHRQKSPVLRRRGLDTLCPPSPIPSDAQRPLTSTKVPSAASIRSSSLVGSRVTTHIAEGALRGLHIRPWAGVGVQVGGVGQVALRLCLHQPEVVHVASVEVEQRRLVRCGKGRGMGGRAAGGRCQPQARGVEGSWAITSLSTCVIRDTAYRLRRGGSRGAAPSRFPMVASHPHVYAFMVFCNTL
jgi:hypothetical protein